MSEPKEKECVISIRSNPSPSSQTGGANNASGNLSTSSITSNVNNNSTSSSIDDLHADNNSLDHNHQKSLNDKLDQSSSDNAGECAEESLGEAAESEPTTSKYLSPASTLDLFRKLEVIKEIR